MAMEQVYFKTGRYMQPGFMEKNDGRIKLALPFSLKDEAKAMSGARWLGYSTPPEKVWEVDDNEHNQFRLAHLLGKNPYAPYDLPLKPFVPKRSLYQHQTDMVRHALTRHYCIFACEMGTGKTLAAIELMEFCVANEHIKDIWYVAPKSALAAVQLEFYKWGCPIKPRFMTYEGLVREMKEWKDGMPAPQMVFFDESSKIKTPTSQRSQAAFALAAGVRNDWGANGYVVLMSGSPAPKAPTDWWSQAQTARPGFLREGNIHKLQQRLAIVEQVEGSDGIKYPKILGWKDRKGLCNICGKLDTVYEHSAEALLCEQGHKFEPCENEVDILHQRLKGLVLIKFKKDCLDLPTKVYRIVKCKPSIPTLNAARLIAKTAPRAAEALVRMRELADGFQYDEKKVGTVTCTQCGGKRTTEDYDQETGATVEISCRGCQGSGEIDSWKRTAIRVECPKDQALLDIIEEHEDDGRLVVFGGFTETIDRVTNLCTQAGWGVVVVDGRGWRGSVPGDNLDMLKAFQSGHEAYPKLVFIGHPGSAGMGLTLTASQTIVYYSNDFNAESRIQSEDRIHRPGSRGANIIDLVHLPTDVMVLENLKRKRDLQSVTMGDIVKAMESDIEAGSIA